MVGELGAIKQSLTDVIDYKVGVKTFHKLKDKINSGDVIFEIYAKNKTQAKEDAPKLMECYHIK